MPKRKKQLAPQPKRSVGRPSKYTAEAADTIVKAIELGNFPEVAAKAAGVDRATFYNWVKSKPDFSRRIELAESRAELMLQGFVLNKSREEWQAARWIMGKRFKDRWAEDAQIAVSGENIQLVVNTPRPKLEDIPIAETPKLNGKG